MRRLLLLVLVALLPLQWSGEAAAVRCLHGGAGHVHAGHAHAGHGDVPHDATTHGHGGHGHAAHAHSRADAAQARDAHGHDAHGRVARAEPSGGHPSLAAPDAPQDVSSPDDARVAALGDCGHAECGGCCHGGVTLPPAAHPVPPAPAFGTAPAVRADASPAAPALDGPFRPPRSRSA